LAHSLRFTFILALAALGTALAAVGGWRFARASAPVPGPIILISIDTLRADHLPAYGYRQVRTPTIDALARDGVLFERAYAHATQTLPAHVAMLTGRLPFETGIRDDVAPPMKAGERLLAQMLHDRGYATAGVVSAAALGKETGLSQGFDLFDAEAPASPSDVAVAAAGSTASQAAQPADEAADSRSPFVPVLELMRDGSETEAIVEKWLSASGSTRLFLFVHLAEPHAPYDPPPEFAEFSPYDGEIAYADAIVGRLVKYLKSHQLYDVSTIVVTSDHGEGLGDHGEREHGLLVYEEALRVPLIVKQAGGVGAGRRIPTLVQHIDLVPTVLDLAKAPGGSGLRGRSLKPLLDGTGSIDEQAIYSEALYAKRRFGWSELTTVTDGRFRYIRGPREELYDLKRDPSESHNIVDDEPRPSRTLRTSLDALVREPRLTGDDLADPKDKVETVERYRRARALAASGKSADAISLLQQVLRGEPQADVVWDELGALTMRVERYDQAVDAYRHVIELRPSDGTAFLSAAGALVGARKLNEAREEAATAVMLSEFDPPTLARGRAMVAYIDGRVLYERGEYAEALPFLENAIGALPHSSAARIADLHYFAGDTLARLDRSDEAEAEFLSELRAFPHSVRARVSLALLYHAASRDDEAAEVASDLVRLSPTADGYSAAARIWTALGDRKQADAIRAEARKAVGAATHPGH